MYTEGVSELGARVARYGVEREAPGAIEDDPALRALSASARRLIAVLETSPEEEALRQPVAAYIACADARGISRDRIYAALELLVHDHALLDPDPPRREPAIGRYSASCGLSWQHPATARVLELVLRLASSAGLPTSHPGRRPDRRLAKRARTSDHTSRRAVSRGALREAI